MAELLFPLQFKRQYSGSLDPDLVFSTSAAMSSYLSDPLRYAGQVVTCTENEGKIFVLNNAKSAWIDVTGTSATGVSNHSLLTNLSANDHPQYSLSGHNHSGVYQPLDADLTSIAGLSGSNGLLKKTSADTWTLDTTMYMPYEKLINSATNVVTVPIPTNQSVAFGFRQIDTSGNYITGYNFLVGTTNSASPNINWAGSLDVYGVVASYKDGFGIGGFFTDDSVYTPYISLYQSISAAPGGAGTIWYDNRFPAIRYTDGSTSISLLDTKTSGWFATSSHNHDGRYLLSSTSASFATSGHLHDDRYVTIPTIINSATDTFRYKVRPGETNVFNVSVFDTSGSFIEDAISVDTLYGTGLNAFNVNGLVYASNSIFTNSAIYSPTLMLNYIGHPSSPTFNLLEGAVWYDTTERSLMYRTDISAASMNVGYELWVRVVNKSGSIIPNGTVVYLDSVQGNRPTIKKAIASSEHNTEMVLGVTTHDIGINAEGLVTTFGTVSEFNTSVLSAGYPLYLSPTVSGDVTQNRPSPPNHAVRIGYPLNSTNNGKIFVNIQNGFELDELHDVIIANPSIGQALIYTSAGIWENKNLLDVIPYASATTNGYLTSSDWVTFSNKLNSSTSAWFASSAHQHNWSQVSATPTTLSGYGITDALNQSTSAQFALSGHSHNLSALGGTLPIGMISAIGTPSDMTYLRGDGTWSTVQGGSTSAINYKQTGTFPITAGTSGTYDVTLSPALSLPYIVQFIDTTDGTGVFQNFSIINYTATSFTVYWNSQPYNKTITWFAVDGSYVDAPNAVYRSGYQTSSTSSINSNDYIVTYTGPTSTTQIIPLATGSGRELVITNNASIGVILTVSATNSTIGGDSFFDLYYKESITIYDAAPNVWEVH